MHGLPNDFRRTHQPQSCASERLYQHVLHVNATAGDSDPES